MKSTPTIVTKLNIFLRPGPLLCLLFLFLGGGGVLSLGILI